MKKVLLSVSLVAAAMFANAQTLIPVYLGGVDNAQDAVNSEDGWVPFEGTAPSDFSVTEITENGNVLLKLVGSSAGYYVWGVNNGQYSEEGEAESFGYTGTADGYIVFRAKVENVNTRIKIGLQTTDKKTFAAEIDLGAAGVSDELKIQNLAFSSLKQEDEFGNPADGGLAPTQADLAKVTAVNVILQVNSCSWNGSDCDLVSRKGELYVDDIFLSQDKLTEIPDVEVATKSAVKLKTAIYPNPATSVVNFGRTLTNVSVYNSNGILVETLNSASSINVESFKAGVYLINSTEGSTRFVVK
jgi:hypothetical protein